MAKAWVAVPVPTGWVGSLFRVRGPVAWRATRRDLMADGSSG